jgi:SAM-dependent methyltransferase
MRKCRDRYLTPWKRSQSELPVVIEMGSRDVHGSYRPLFSDDNFAYVGYDVEPGDGVDILLFDPYHIPLPDASVDVVLCGQLFQRCEQFWRTFKEMMRVLRRNGHLFLITPSAGPTQPRPIDCYRFYPDAYYGLAHYAGCQLVDVWHDDRGPWNDLVGVFRRRDADPEPSDEARAGERVTAEYRHWLRSNGAVGRWHDGPPEAERVAGAIPYLDLLARLHALVRPRLYFEVGVGKGDSLALAAGGAVGIDPLPKLAVELSSWARVRELTSDQYFDGSLPETDLAAGIDLAFIDGLHQFEQCLRDFINVERYMAPAGLIVIDDILPNHPLQAERRRQSSIWMGDVWKMASCLKTYRPDLLVLILDTRPSGLMLVTGLNPADRRLRDQYNAIVEELGWSPSITVPTSVLERDGVLAPSDGKVVELLRLLRELRETELPHEEVRPRLQEWQVQTGL